MRRLCVENWRPLLITYDEIQSTERTRAGRAAGAGRAAR